MTDLLRPVLDFMDAGGMTMPPLLLCCACMWYCILRAWLDLAPASAALDETARARTRRRLSMASVLAGAAPLLGLLGTVTGMIDTFDSVARFGMVNSKALSSGISQAMISTQTGLVVAVPGLIAVYFLRRRIHRLRARHGVCPASGGDAV